MACKNCQQELSDQDKYCRRCGCEVIRDRLTIRHLVREFYESFFSWETNRPIRTFVDLIRRPEVVIDGYISGVRKKYNNPFGYVAISLTLSGLFFFAILKFSPEALDAMMGLQSSSGNPQELGRRIQNISIEYHTLIFFALLPLFALLSWMLFYKRKYNYAEHLILNLYAYAEISNITFLIMAITIWSTELFSKIAIYSLVIQTGYYSYTLKRVFNLNFVQFLIKMGLLLGLVILLYIIIILFFGILMYLTGNLDTMVNVSQSR